MDIHRITSVPRENEQSVTNIICVIVLIGFVDFCLKNVGMVS